MYKKDSKTGSGHEELRTKNAAIHDNPKGAPKFRSPELRISKLLDLKDLTVTKQWYQQNYDRNESRSCPVCQDLSIDLANLPSRAGTFKFVTPVGTLTAAFVGTYLAVFLEPDQSIIASTTIQITISTVIATTTLIALLVYWVVQRDSGGRTRMAFKLTELSRMRMNKTTISTDSQEYYPQHQKLVPPGTY